MRAVTLAALVVAPLLAAGCVTTPAVDPSYKLRPETRPECAAHCDALGMRLGAIVLIRNAAGCVCEPREAPPEKQGARPPAGEPRAALQGGGSAAAGAALIAIQEEQRRRQQADDDLHRHHPSSGH
jgi:hypothetical protein